MILCRGLRVFYRCDACGREALGEERTSRSAAGTTAVTPKDFIDVIIQGPAGPKVRHACSTACAASLNGLRDDLIGSYTLPFRRP